jgi:hypothetical protein
MRVSPIEKSLGKSGILSYFNGPGLETEMTPIAFKLISAEDGAYMKWKLVSAFATGAVLASGIVYFAVRPAVTAPDAVQVTAPKVEPPKHREVAQTNIPPPPAVRKPVHVAVREKPSPFRPPVQREKPVAVAKYTPVPAPPPAAPSITPTLAPPPAAPAPREPAPHENVPTQNVSLPALSIPAPSLPARKTDSRVAPTVTLAAGTVLPVRIGQSLSSARNQPGDSFLATLIQPLVIGGWVIAERGARLEGRVDAAQSGRVKGVAHLEISIVRVALSDGQNIRVGTEPYAKEGSGSAIGAILGAGGGTAEIPVETRVSFRVKDSITITERLD